MSESTKHEQIVRDSSVDDWLYGVDIIIVLGFQCYRLSSTTKCGKTLQIRQIRDSWPQTQQARAGQELYIG